MKVIFAQINVLPEMISITAENSPKNNNLQQLNVVYFVLGFAPPLKKLFAFSRYTTSNL